ncbi:hypothetical protein [Teredinibacter turnerae]|uniref:hypothetical protein n=1 Tax=Teredinibacter turnerae TaxID=2426 RepID=UPI00036D6182|nr:hypothetical protein [Teredinibacter turnerae]
MNRHKILMIYAGELSSMGAQIADQFEADRSASVEEGLAFLKQGSVKAVVYDAIPFTGPSLDDCTLLLQSEHIAGVPLLVLSDRGAIKDRLKAFEIGCDDFLDSAMGCDEACARITKSIFHQIAQQQLKSRLTEANVTAHTAMADNSDLGANIQFLLAINDCDNLDELGQQLFSTLRRYGLHCSLQMRSVMGDKNMEDHGMAKDLESLLLAQLADGGRYIDFGNRTIVNYDKVSLLIKNMPVQDADKYGAVKDNTFALLQGVNARIRALEDRYRLVQEKASLLKLSEDVGMVMVSLKDSYQQVMRDIVNEVENVAELIQLKLPALALSEAHEQFLEEATLRVVSETNRVFNDGLKIDECFEKLESAIESSLTSVETPAEFESSASRVKSGNQTDSSIDLF